MASGKGAVGGLGCAGAFLVFGLAMLFLFLPVLMGTGMYAVEIPSAQTCRVVAEEDEGSDLRGVPEQWVGNVEAAAEVAGVPAAVLAAQIGAESSWDPTAVHPRSRAAGLAQFTPETWAAYGKGDPLDPVASIEAMGVYMGELRALTALHSDGDGDLQLRLALGAYNWGQGNMARNGWSLEGLPTETSDYIAKILDGGQLNYSPECESFAGETWDGDLGDGEWTSPLPGGTMTSAGAYGPRNIPGYPAWANNHAGIDLATPGGNGTVVAPMPMRVTGLYPIDGCVLGKATVGPPFGLEFCHLEVIGVEIDDELGRGGKIGVEGGVAGNLGGRTTPHLHYAMYDPSGPDPKYPGHQNPVIDPTPLLRQKGAL